MLKWRLWVQFTRQMQFNPEKQSSKLTKIEANKKFSKEKFEKIINKMNHKNKTEHLNTFLLLPE